MRTDFPRRTASLQSISASAEASSGPSCSSFRLQMAPGNTADFACGGGVTDDSLRAVSASELPVILRNDARLRLGTVRLQSIGAGVDGQLVPGSSPVCRDGARVVGALTKVAARPGEGEKVDHLSRWRAVLGACDARCARLERDAYPEYWPFRGARARPLSTTRRRVFVANKFGSAKIGEFDSFLRRNAF